MPMAEIATCTYQRQLREIKNKYPGLWNYLWNRANGYEMFEPRHIEWLVKMRLLEVHADGTYQVVARVRDLILNELY